MPIVKGTTNIGGVFKGTTEIASVYKGTTLVYENGTPQEVSGVPPLTLPNSIRRNVVDYKIYGYSSQTGTPDPTNTIEIKSVGTKTINLLDIYNRTKGTLSGSQPSTVRSFDYTKYYVGITSNNYYVPSNVTKATLTNGVWSVQAVDSGHTPYGVGFPIPVSQNTRYYVIGDIEDGSITIGYFDINGNYLSQSTTLTTSFLTPANAVTAVIIFKANSTTEATFKNVQISLIETSQYNPYGYRIPVSTSGKNVINISNVVRTGNLSYEVSGNDLILTPTASSASGNYYINMGNYSDFVGKTMTFNTSIITNSSTASVQLWLIATKSNQGWTNNDTLKNKDVAGGTTGGYTFTIPQGNYFQLVLRLYIHNNTNSDTITIRELQAEFGETATTYTPFTYPVATTDIYLQQPLNKIGTLVDYIDFENQKIVRNTKTVVFNGSEPFSPTSLTVTGYFTCTQNRADRASSYSNSLCTHFKYGSGSANLMFWGGSNNNYFYFRIADSYGVTSTDTFKTWLNTQYKNDNPVVLVYPIATPTEESVTLPAILLRKGTNIISVGTDPQPSNMWVKYKAKV